MPFVEKNTVIFGNIQPHSYAGVAHLLENNNNLSYRRASPQQYWLAYIPLKESRQMKSFNVLSQK